MKPEQVTSQAVEERKLYLRSKGIAQYVINGKTEEESIRISIAEKYSFFFVAVRDPYYDMKAKAGNLRFRIFQTLKENPMIPMGYAGTPGFTFECYTGEPLKMAVELLKKNLSKTYKFSSKDDEITCQLVKNEEEKKLEAEKAAEEDNEYKVKETDSKEVKALKTRIARLIQIREDMLEVNKIIRAGGDPTAKLGQMGLTFPQTLSELKGGFPSWRFTSISGKIRREKAKVKSC
jgi:hypothetical protein